MGASSNQPGSARERFGNFVLLAENERTWLATEYRAAHLGETGFDRLVQLVRFNPASKAGAPDTLVEHVKAAMKVGGPGVLRALGTGRNGAGWLSYEYYGGHSLGAVLAKAREEGFPLALDNALEIARQVCLTLEKAHARSVAGAPLLHGFLSPWSVLVSYDGAVRLRGFGLWAGRALGGLPPEEAGHLAPEQAEQKADVRSDVYGLGTLVLAALRGAPIAGGADPRTLLPETMTIEGEPLPADLMATIERALSPRPDSRHQTVAEFRQELEAMLFAGEVAPTTFNLAFFMETLYRGMVEEEARAIDADTHADYEAYMRGPEPAAPEPPPPAPVAAPPVAPTPVVAAPAAALPLVPPPPRVPAPVAVAAPPPPRVEPPPPAAVPDRAKADTSGGSKTPLIAAAAAAVLLLGGGAFYFLKMRPSQPATPPTTTLSAEAQAAVARVQELEARLKALEEERMQAEAAAAEAARLKLEQEAKARGKTVDPRALEKAQEEAAKKVRMQEEKRQEEERQALEKKKREEEARLAAVVPAPTLPPVTEPPVTVPPATEPPATMVAEAAPAADPSAAPSVYEFGAAGVVPPSLVSQPPLEYPLVARASRITGSVTVAAIVDEQGRVTGARATSGNPVLRKAAVDHIAGRKYRPAQKDGTPVKMQLIVQVNFKG